MYFNQLSLDNLFVDGILQILTDFEVLFKWFEENEVFVCILK